MASVTGRIKEVKQPWGGYIKPSSFEAIVVDDGFTLNSEENIHGSNIGLTVDYLTRFIMTKKAKDAFNISLLGAQIAEQFGAIEDALEIAYRMLANIKELDNGSIINACRLVTFDAWYRNPMGAALAKMYYEIKPDKSTIENIRIMVNRSIAFFDKYGPIVKEGFTFESASGNKDDLGGYTATVNTGDGDFITADTLWDFKVSKSKPTNKHTLQLLMYWIMGKHSGQDIFKSITKLGIFNPRLNTIYTFELSKVPDDVIKAVEKDVICY